MVLYYPVCNFGKVINFGLATVRSVRFKEPANSPNNIFISGWCFAGGGGGGGVEINQIVFSLAVSLICSLSLLHVWRCLTRRVRTCCLSQTSY